MVSNTLETPMKLHATRTTVCLVLCGFAFRGIAQTQPPTKSPTPTISTPTTAAAPQLFSRAIKKTIAIIYTKCEGDTQTYEGTGFFVFRADARLGENRGFAYLVTNRHVVLPHIEIGQPCKVVEQFLRVNSKTPDPKTGGRNVL